MKSADFKRFISAWMPPLLFMTFIFMFSSQSSLPQAFVPLFKFLKDKTLHALEYGTLTCLYLRAARLWFPRACPMRIALYCALAACLYGLSDEWHQVYVPQRTAELSDMLADCVGAIMAAGAFLYFIKLKYGTIHGCQIPNKPD
jgi:VanZ family protein